MTSLRRLWTAFVVFVVAGILLWAGMFAAVQNSRAEACEDANARWLAMSELFVSVHPRDALPPDELDQYDELFETFIPFDCPAWTEF